MDTKTSNRSISHQPDLSMARSKPFVTGTSISFFDLKHRAVVWISGSVPYPRRRGNGGIVLPFATLDSEIRLDGDRLESNNGIKREGKPGLAMA